VTLSKQQDALRTEGERKAGVSWCWSYTIYRFCRSESISPNTINREHQLMLKREFQQT